MSLRIMGLHAENVKRLKLVDIEFKGNVTKITGMNRQGKSSTIDAILLALGGGEAVKLTGTTEPIHKGAKGAVSVVDLGDYVATRTWTADGKSSLKVESKSDNKKVSSPQTLLDNLIGDLSFDPLEFMDMDTQKQIKTLHKIIGFDPAPLDERRKAAYDERALVNRQVKDSESKVRNMKSYEHDNLPEKEVSAKDMMDKFTEANKVIEANKKEVQKLEDLRKERNYLTEEIEENTTLIKDLELQIEQIKEQIEQTKEQIVIGTQAKSEITVKGKAQAALVANLVEPNLESIQLEMNTISETNDKIRERKSYLEAYAQLEALKQESDKYTKEIEEIDHEKANALQNANLPIQGLSFTDSGIAFNEVPLTQASHADNIIVSMSIGMAVNPNLRTMFVKDGEKFDSNTWKMVEKLAQDNDYQLIVEMVEESGNVGIYIEDGMVVTPVKEEKF